MPQNSYNPQLILQFIEVRKPGESDTIAQIVNPIY